MSQLAQACGIEMMECRLLELDGVAHFMTRRFDRQSGSRQHVHTFSAMCHLFQGNGAEAMASYEQLFMAIERLGMGYAEKEQMFRRMVFNVIVGECDDHVKNFAFLLKEGGKWGLAPAYDLTGTPEAGEDESWSAFPQIHAMSVNGKQKDISKNDMLVVGDRFGIGESGRIISEIEAKVKGEGVGVESRGRGKVKRDSR